MTARPPIPPSAATVRPGHDGRPHPDPRADPPTAILDNAAARTVRLASVSDDTVRITTAPVAAGGNGGLADGLALSISAALGALAGLVSWLIAARIMPKAEVGDATLVVSIFQLVGGIAQLNLGVALLRWLPGAGRRSGKLVWSALLLIMPLSGAIALVYGLVQPRLAEISAGNGPVGLGLLFFVLAAAGWGVFVVHDFILVAIGKPWWAVWRNGLFAIVRIVLLVVLGGSLGLAAYGVVLSWVAPIVVWVAAGSVLVYLLIRKVARAATGGALPDRAAVLGFVGPTAIAQVGVALLFNQVPALVNIRFGNELGAVFFMAFQAVIVLDTAGMFFVNSLSVSIAREPQRVAELAATARKRLLMFFLPAMALGAALAHPLLLLIFGPDYAAADLVLQLLLLGLAFRLVVVHELGVRQAVGKAVSYARLQLISTVLVLLVVAAVPVLGSGVDALVPVAIGYVIVQALCAATVLFLPVWRRVSAGGSS